MHGLRWLVAIGALLAGATHAHSHSRSRKEDHRVTELPGFHTEFSFDHYAGLMQLETDEKLFYWYAESQSKPEKDPLVLWLNGGPGCSSLGGFFTENGPFVVRNDLTLEENTYSWNRHTNLVWLESPAGVGFSGPVQHESYYNDDNVAQKTYEFLELFIEQYSELKGTEFYVTGESYAGMYIPFLIDLLVKKPIHGLNLKGFAIGNAYTDATIDNNAYMDYYYTHAMVSAEDYATMNKHCGSQLGRCVDGWKECPSECKHAIKVAMDSSDEDYFDPYNIYGDICMLGNNQASHLRYRRNVLPSRTHRGDIGPCADTYTHYYLRIPEVQKALHVDDYVKWSDCSDDVSDRFTRADTALPKYKNILNADLKVLIYSGDADSVVNFIGTQRWIGKAGLDLPVVNKWEAWFGPDDQHAGYVQDYEGLTFKTVKGAGHMVPAVRPLHGLSMFECFVFSEHECKDFDYPVDAEEIEADLPIVYSSDLHARVRGAKATTSIVPRAASWGISLLGVALVGVAAVLVHQRLTRRRAYELISA